MSRVTVYQGRASRRWWWECLNEDGSHARLDTIGYPMDTQPEALAAALAHLATHHPKEDQ